MQVKINVKGVSNKKNKILQMVYDYPDGIENLEQFLTETVKICVRDYNERKDCGELLGIFSKEQMENQAQTGKISFGTVYNEKQAKEKDAIENALQCFLDGMVAVFIDGERKEELTEQVCLTKQSEVTFVRLTFLVGRMW